MTQTAMPSFEEFVKLEVETLNTLLRIHSLRSCSSELQTAVTQAAASTKGMDRRPRKVDIHLSFLWKTKLRGDNKPINRAIDIGALVDCVGDNTTQYRSTYSLVICDGDMRSIGQVARKLHFDFEPASSRVSGSTAEEKPSHHIQVCGKLSSGHRESGYEDRHIEHLFPSWENPRIPSLPFSLCLLLHWFFREFPVDQGGQKILSNGAWTALVQRAQAKVVRPYLIYALECIQSKAGPEKMLSGY